MKRNIMTVRRKFFKRIISGTATSLRFKQFLLQLQRTCKYITYTVVEACGLNQISYKLSVTY